MTLTPSGSVTRTGGSGLPSTGGVVTTARKSTLCGTQVAKRDFRNYTGRAANRAHRDPKPRLRARAI